MTLVRLAEVADFVPSRATASDGEAIVRTVTSGCLKLAGFDVRGIRLNRMHFWDVEAATIKPGEVLFSRSNTGDLVGRAAVAPSDLDTVVASDLVFRLVPRPRLHADFLARLLMGLQLTGYWTNRSSGASSTMKKITRAQLGSLSFELPSLAEQRRVATELTAQLAAVDAGAIGASERVEIARLLRARAYVIAFGDSVPLSTQPASSASPAGWSWHSLTDLARLETGHTPSRSRPDWWTGDVPWIALPDIRRLDGKIASETIETTNADGIANSSARVLPVDTVVMSRTASVGFVTRMGRPMATSQDFVNWVCGPDLDPEFLMHLLIRSRDEIRALSSGAIHKTVYFPTVKAFRVCVPAIDDQRRIVAELSERLAAIDAMGVSIRAEQEAIEALPAALLRRAFQDIAA